MYMTEEHAPVPALVWENTKNGEFHVSLGFGVHYFVSHSLDEYSGETWRAVFQNGSSVDEDRIGTYRSKHDAMRACELFHAGYKTEDQRRRFAVQVRATLDISDGDIAAMVEAFDNVAKAPRDMKVRRIEAAAFALRDRFNARHAAQPVAQTTHHPDDVAVDLFAAAMKAKLEYSRNKHGRSGWNDKSDCSAEHLSDLLRGHVAKGDPLDVANFACFLWNRQERIADAVAQTGVPDWVGGVLWVVRAGDF